MKSPAISVSADAPDALLTVSMNLSAFSTAKFNINVYKSSALGHPEALIGSDKWSGEMEHETTSVTFDFCLPAGSYSVIFLPFAEGDVQVMLVSIELSYSETTTTCKGFDATTPDGRGMLNGNLFVPHFAQSTQLTTQTVEGS